MALSRASLRILPHEYGLFLGMIHNDPRLPDRYESWIRRIREEDAHHVANDEVITEVVVTYEEFSGYCASAGQEPCYDMLMAFTLAKVAGMKR